MIRIGLARRLDRSWHGRWKCDYEIVGLTAKEPARQPAGEVVELRSTSYHEQRQRSMSHPTCLLSFGLSQAE